jgi:hypothetical protein
VFIVGVAPGFRSQSYFGGEGSSHDNFAARCRSHNESTFPCTKFEKRRKGNWEIDLPPSRLKPELAIILMLEVIIPERRRRRNLTSAGRTAEKDTRMLTVADKLG